MNWLNNSFPALLMAFTIKVTIVLVLCSMIAGILYRRSAAHRHPVWAAGILGSLAVPLFETLIPPHYSAPLAGAAAHWDSRTRLLLGTVSNSPFLGGSNHGPGGLVFANLLTVVLMIWAIGLSLVALKLLIGIIQLMRISATARLLRRAEWEGLVAEIAKSFGMARSVRILQCRGIHQAMPLTWGVFRPRIILPGGAKGWTKERRRIVLAHELAHINRQDWLLQMCAELLCCFYWFHPMVWIAARKLRQESEYACDDAVLNYGIAASDYAQELLAKQLKARTTTGRLLLQLHAHQCSRGDSLP